MKILNCNKEVDSMDGNVDIETSPRLSVIENAQEKLRQEYDVREERKRELEFLLKGGNPLDFNCGHAASISTPSTSFTDKQAAPCVISEAEGCFAPASSSPHDDSIESSGRPETNIADNLSLLDTENSRRRRGIFLKGTNKRGNASLQEQTSKSEDSLMFHLGVKSQAYIRRNRSRSNREVKSNIREARVQNQRISHIFRSKPSSPNGNIIPKATGEKKSGMEIDAEMGIHNENKANMIGDLTQKNLNGSSPKRQFEKDKAVILDFDLVSSEPNGIIEGNIVTAKEGDANEQKNASDVKTEVNEARELANSEDLETKPEESRESSLVSKILECESVKENGLEAPTTKTDSLNFTIQVKDEIKLSDSSIDVAEHESLKKNDELLFKPEKRENEVCLGGNSNPAIKMDIVACDVEPSASTSPTVQSSEEQLIENKIREDLILKEARMIEEKIKRSALICTSNKSLEKQRKTHWDFVLEEMAWMANDFMQERLWKTAIASRISHHIASSGIPKFKGEIIHQQQKNVAKKLANAVMKFWQYADVFRTTGVIPASLDGVCNLNLVKARKFYIAKNDQSAKPAETSNAASPTIIRDYAVRLLSYEHPISTHSSPVYAPSTPERIKDAAIMESSWENDFSEEFLFYTVPPGSMQAYKEAMESQWLTYKKIVSPVNHEDSVASPCDYLPDGPRKIKCEEEEGESGSYYMPGSFEGTNKPRFIYKKKKNFPHKFAGRPYHINNDFPYERKPGSHVIFTGNNKRYSSTSNAGSIPTKRIRTTGRQRIASPYGPGPTGINSRTDVSSGDTNSLEDDRSSMHCGSQSRKNMEMESTADFEKRLPYDASETSKSRKKSKILGYSNNPDVGVLVASEKGSMFDQRVHGDSLSQLEQRVKAKKRLENQQYDSNGHIGIYGQTAAKKIKHPKQFAEPLHEGIMIGNGSMQSPVASQMSNMPNHNKFIKALANRERGRKSKANKMISGLTGSSWTMFEDQALIVFVHDMGPNWELVSDAINNTLQFKCIFRKPEECKERHKILLEKSVGDGADSAEDSCSSQPYQSTLPGIPKGSAGPLFRHLQIPMEEDMLKDHFKKIISAMQKLHLHMSQKDSQEVKQIAPVHSSHHAALSQACPNNLGGGFLTPFDLIDSVSSNQDAIAFQYQGSQMNGSAIPSQQGSLLPIVSNTSCANTTLPGSPNLVVGSNLAPTSIPVIAPARGDPQRYCMSRTASLPDDQHKNQYVLSTRNINGGLKAGIDKGPPMLPGGNNMGMMNVRTASMPRPGFQGMLSPGMVSSGNMLASGGGAAGTGKAHPGVVASPGNSMLRTRPGQTMEDHRQMMMQVSQGNNGPSVPPFNALSAPFSTTTPSFSSIPFPGQTYPMRGSPHGHQHAMNHSQQAYAIRMAKERAERQLQQKKIMPQSQQPYVSSNAMSSSTQISNPSLKPLVQPSSNNANNNNKQMPRNPQVTSQPNKLRPHLQVHQPRNPHLQKQQMKGLIGGPAMLMHQNLAADTSQVGGDKKMSQPGSVFFSGTSALTSNMPHKMYSQQPSQTTKQTPPLPSHSDTSLQRMVVQPNRKPNSDSQTTIVTTLPRSSDNGSSVDARCDTQAPPLPPVSQSDISLQRLITRKPGAENQTIPSTSHLRNSDVTNSVEARCDANAASSIVTNAQVIGSPLRNVVGNGTTVTTNISGDGDNSVGKQCPQPHRHGLHDVNLYSRSSNSGSS